MNNENKVEIISKWVKPGSRYVKRGDEFHRETTGKQMAMVFVWVNGQKVTRHIVL